MDQLRIISWNISLRGPIKDKMDLLQSVINETDGPTLVALQEVIEKDRAYITEEKIFSTHSYSIDFRTPGPFDTRNRKLGCMIGVTSNSEASNPGVIQRTPFPDRTLYTDITIDNFTFKLICFHSLTGVGYKKAKTTQYVGIAEYLHLHRDIPMICCFDANEPAVDHYDIEKVKFFNQAGDKGMGAALIMSSNPLHNMRDSYRTWLVENMDVFNEIKDKQQAAQDEKTLKYIPLTTSHIINKKYHKRYDYIFNSSNFNVKNVQYRLDESLKAGSDHAMVVTDYEIRC
ncbi:hypothetical protein GH741_02650 [Aquibacillus halophilus]|uniref:Endonuclease/exonuclease/phosphatase family protein n=1 Tax=Aquibacillus halophilus TaxID=930132 RepID=A0A6A8DCR5_9BACI|nr:hypothetical protein [Aquibacillus halophilus]MRH41571.1 hypothetical protein [Aquibacillus halophilus]